ncbi:PQQ-binding-like beta-propeller repeat protein [Bacteroidales bacterium]|nr:PQQ-binding-like beta-propeller repeat protein [Bacteroidales bacterium]
MKPSKYILIGLGLLSLVILFWWNLSNPVRDLSESIPGADKQNEGEVAKALIKIGEFFELFERSKTNLYEDWPCFRGAERDNIYRSNIPLINKFSEDTTDLLWKVELGEGHGGAAIYNGLVYILDYHEEQRADMLRCFDLISGTELWRRWYKVGIKRNHGISRTVPALTEDYILTIGPRCHAMCVDRESGDFLWGIDIAREYESEIPLWYTGQCPLIDNNKAIIATGGKALMVAVDCKSGKVLWETPNTEGWKMSHSSVVPFTFKGKKMYVYAAVGGICGISAEGKDVGEILWETSDWDHAVVAPSAVCMNDGKIYLTAGYGAGAMVLQLSESNGIYTTSILQEYKPSEGLACEQQTPILYKGHLFGIMPKDGGMLRNRFVCVDPNNCKEIIWASDKSTRFGLGPYIFADDKFYILKDDGTLFIAEADLNGYKQLSAKQYLKGHDAWAPLAIADGYMVLRDSKTMICINLNTQ